MQGKARAISPLTGSVNSLSTGGIFILPGDHCSLFTWLFYLHQRLIQPSEHLGHSYAKYMHTITFLMINIRPKNYDCHLIIFPRDVGHLVFYIMGVEY